MCVDRVVQPHHAMDAAVLAMNENPANEPPPIVLRPGEVLHPFRMALVTQKKWSNGRKLKVKFLDGSVTQKKQVQRFANEWSQFANVTFDFNGGATAEIRISFRQSGSWSAVGVDCLQTGSFPKTQPTMNFGWLRDDTDDVEWRRVVVHEFGHALGAIHEHQNPKGGIKWNLPRVYAAFSGPPNNWDKQTIDFNIIQKYSINQLNATEFDAKSIMLYHFDASLIIGGKATPNNTDLSAGDKKFIAQMYPKAGAHAIAASSTPRLALSAPADAAGAWQAPNAAAAPAAEFSGQRFRDVVKQLQKLRAR
ncbi:MAG: Tolloid-like protein 1 [Acidobacteria bacterium]|nr:Tolloid-like protein 1 [Acidobacteriota bacterium]